MRAMDDQFEEDDVGSSESMKHHIMMVPGGLRVVREPQGSNAETQEKGSIQNEKVSEHSKKVN